MQLIEALGDENRWYCSQKLLRPVHEEEVLMTHFIRNGGAANFAKRWRDAMGDKNRWYCAQFYGYQVIDEEVLWRYFVDHARDGERAQCRSSSDLLFT
jgi:hypothetical protein